MKTTILFLLFPVMLFSQDSTSTMYHYDQIINNASSLHAELTSFRNTIDSLNARIQYLETKIPLVAQGGALRPYDVFSKVPNSVNAPDARKWRHEGDNRIRRVKIIRIDEEAGEVIGIVYTGYNPNGYWESKVSEGYIMGQWSSFYYEGKQYQDIKNPFK